MTLSILPNVDGQILGGQLGLSDGATIEQLGIIGVSSAGPTTVRTLDRSSLPGLAALYGSGPLVRAVRDAFQNGATLVKALRCATEQAGSLGTVDSSLADGTGAVAFTGAPLDDYQIEIRITKGGARGTAQFEYSINGGRTYQPELVTAASVTLPGTGLAVTFTAQGGGPTSESFLLGDVHTVQAFAPSPTSTEVATAIDDFKDQAWSVGGAGPHLILIAGPTGDTVWAVCDTAAQAFHAEHRYVAFICEAIGPETAQTAAQWVDALLADKTTYSDFVAIVAARTERTDITGLTDEVSASGAYAGRLTAIPPLESPARVKRDRQHTGPIDGARALRPAVEVDGGEAIPSLTEALIKELSDAGFVTARSFFGRPGVYFTEGRMSSLASSDLGTIERVRPALEALHVARLAALDELFGDASPAGLRQIEAVAQGALDSLVAQGRIPAARALVDIAQDVTATGYVAVQVLLQFAPKAKWISITAQWARSLPGAE